MTMGSYATCSAESYVEQPERKSVLRAGPHQLLHISKKSTFGKEWRAQHPFVMSQHAAWPTRLPGCAPQATYTQAQLAAVSGANVHSCRDITASHAAGLHTDSPCKCCTSAGAGFDIRTAQPTR
jgi:hypothetical protein